MGYGNNNYPERASPNPRAAVEILRLSGEDTLAVTLEEMKLDLRVDSDDEDMTIQRLIKGATDYFRIRTGWQLCPATFQANVGGCGGKLTIELGPVRDVLAVSYWDCEGRQWTALDVVTWYVEARGREFDIYFEQAALDLLPAPTALRTHPVRVQFTAGFDDPVESETTAEGYAEDGMITSLKSLVAVQYENREAGAAAGTWAGADPARDFLLGAYRKFW